MSWALTPADVDFRHPDGAISPTHGRLDPTAAWARAQQVFLHGHGLPARWQGRERFVVVETGFGLGLNFIATWDAWRRDPHRSQRLCFVSVEPQPLRGSDLARAHALNALPATDLLAQLRSQWPPLTRGLHRLSFDGGPVELLLAFGDARAMAQQWVLQADAINLDGTAPHREPPLWDEWLIKHLARQAAPGATLAAASDTPALRRALRAAGFEVNEAAEPASAPAMTTARFTPRHTPQRPAGREPLAPGAREAVILGAGLAGAACAHALAQHGVHCTVLDALQAPAQASSGNPAGLFHGTVNPDDGLHARFNRAAALATQRLLATLNLPHQPGLLRLEHRLAAEAMVSVAGYVEALTPAAASPHAGRPLDSAAWFYPSGGALAPGAYVQAMLAASGAQLQLNCPVHALRREGDDWVLLAADGQVLARTALLVLAGGHAQLPLLGAWGSELQTQRGQLTHLAQAPWCPTTPIAGDGYAIADGQGGVWCGATTHDGDLDPALRASCQDDNLTRYARLAGLPDGAGLPPALRTAPLAGRVGWRLLAPDRLPLIGGVPAPDAPLAEQLRLQPRQPGLVLCTALGSRGITWAALAGQLVAALALGSPRPLEADLLDAVDPARFALRRQRRPGR